MTTTEIDFDAAYRVDGYDGVAWRVWEYAKLDPPSECQGHDPMETDSDHEDEFYYCDGECLADYEPEDDRERVIAVMVGDDRKFNFGVDEIHVIPEDDFCSQCGQIGCTHDGREQHG
jgi:hypothetical protein